jgi:hypothetical protein
MFCQFDVDAAIHTNPGAEMAVCHTPTEPYLGVCCADCYHRLESGGTIGLLVYLAEINVSHSLIDDIRYYRRLICLAEDFAT